MANRHEPFNQLDPRCPMALMLSRFEEIQKNNNLDSEVVDA
jgi:hypothetical protein